MTSMTSVPVARKIGRYEILREIGRGATAMVYLARQTDLDRDVVRRPSIVGVPNVRATLACRRGAWTGSPPITFAYTWQRCSPVRPLVATSSAT